MYIISVYSMVYPLYFVQIGLFINTFDLSHDILINYQETLIFYIRKSLVCFIID